MRRIHVVWIPLAVACGSGKGSPIDSSSGDSPACEPPDMLIVLDHTLSMSARPDGVNPINTPAGHLNSKWGIAITAIKGLTAQLDTTLRFGLELFPRNPNNGTCVTIMQELAGTDATNPSCQQGEIDVAPDLGTSSMISSFLDPETTQLCISTPIGAGLETGLIELAAIRAPGRRQFIVLLTDGGDTCNAALAPVTVESLALMGIQTYVIGFGAASGTNGINRTELNNLACAGRTATNFATSCQVDAQGNYTAVNPTTDTLFLLATDAASLDSSFRQAAGQVCCGCIL